MLATIRWVNTSVASHSYHFVAVYLWLLWVFVAAHELSLVAVSRGYSSCGAQSSCSGGFSLSFFKLEDNYFTILCWFLPYTNEPAIDIHISLPWTSLPPSTPFPTLVFHRALDLGSLHHAANSCWLSILHMVAYMLLCYSLKSSHPLLPPLCSKVCSLCLCFLCCPAHGVISTIFLDSIYMC